MESSKEGTISRRAIISLLPSTATQGPMSLLQLLASSGLSRTSDCSVPILRDLKLQDPPSPALFLNPDLLRQFAHRHGTTFETCSFYHRDLSPAQGLTVRSPGATSIPCALSFPGKYGIRDADVRSGLEGCVAVFVPGWPISQIRLAVYPRWGPRQGSRWLVRNMRVAFPLARGDASSSLNKCPGFPTILKTRPSL